MNRGTPEQIYNILRHNKDWMKLKDLAASLHLKDERQFRGADGLIERASKELFRTYGCILITRTGNPSGVKLTNDPEEIRNASKQLLSHHRAELQRACKWIHYADRLDTHSSKRLQMTLFNSTETTGAAMP